MAQQPLRTGTVPSPGTPVPRPATHRRPPTRSGSLAGRGSASPGATLAVTSAATTVALMNYIAPLTTLPDIATSLGTSVSAHAWLLNGTPLGLAVPLLIVGSLADDFGRRRVFLIGTLALGIMTALGALTTNTLGFTLTRVGQGAATAAILATSLGLLVDAYPAGHARIKAMGVWGAFVSGGIALGPVLAGLLGIVDWRLTYLVLGIGSLVTGAFGFRALSESRAPRPGRPDVAGALALGLAMTALVTALTFGREGWLRAPVVLLMVASLVLTATFVVVERRATAPLIALSLFRSRTFLASGAGGLFSGLSVIGLFSYLPTLLQHSIGISELNTAWLFLLWSGTAFVVALQARRLYGRISVRHQLVIGFLLHGVAVLPMLGVLTGTSDISSTSWMRLVGALIVSGVGTGLINSALPRLAVESVPPDRAAMGSGANNTARYIGSSAGVAVTIAVSATSSGADAALLLSVGLALAAAVILLLLRDRKATASR